jgi:hypothetical protein
VGLLDRFFTPAADRERAVRDAALADPAIDRLVAATDHRLAFVPDFRKTLRAPVIAARAQLAEAIARIPGPLEVGSKAWALDPTVRALFASSEDAARTFSSDAGMRAWFDAHPAADGFGMLGLLMTERRVIASAMQGDVVQADVARTTLSFSEPQILGPSADADGVRSELAMRALEYLALRALERVGAQRAQKRELERDRALLNAQLRLAQRKGMGFGAISPVEGEGGATDKAAIERDLERVVGELEKVASKSLLPVLLEELVEALQRWQQHLSIEPCTVALDSMNFVVPAGPDHPELGAAVLTLARRGPFAVVIARFPRSELRAPENRFAEAAKYL